MALGMSNAAVGSMHWCAIGTVLKITIIIVRAVRVTGHAALEKVVA